MNQVKTKTSENDNVYIVSKRFNVITLTRKKARQCLKIFHRLRRDGQNFEGRYRLREYLREAGGSDRHEHVSASIQFFFCVRLHETGLTMISDRSDFVSVVGPRREILVPV